MVELVVVLGLALLMLTVAGAYSIPALARERMRSAAFDVHICMQLARVQAVGRNHACRCVVDTDARTLTVLDTMGTATSVDDVELHGMVFSQSIMFARPTAGPAITLDQIGATNAYQAVYASDGSVESGVGDVHLLGGDRYGRVSVFAAGGTHVTRWNGTEWVNGP